MNANLCLAIFKELASDPTSQMSWLLILFSVFTSLALLITQEMDVDYFKHVKSRIFKIYYKSRTSRGKMMKKRIAALKRKKPLY